MKKNQIIVGGVYVAKVSGELHPVKVLMVRENHGYEGLNLDTNRRVLIRSAARFRRSISAEELKMIPWRFL